MRVRRTSGIATSCHPGLDVVTDAGLRVEEVRGSLDQVGVYVVVVPVDWESRRGLRHQRGSTVSDGSCHVQISAVAHDHGECHESDGKSAAKKRDKTRHQAALAGRNWHYVAQASSTRSSGCRDAASFPSCAPRGQGPCGCARGTPFKVVGGLFPQRLNPSRPRLFSGYESPAYILLQAATVSNTRRVGATSCGRRTSRICQWWAGTTSRPCSTTTHARSWPGS